MLRRDVKRSLRYPALTIGSISVPALFLLLFAGVFGHTLRAGLGPSLSGAGYIDYLAPGILVMTACAAGEATAISVAADMSDGIIARFRTMAIARASVLTGKVLGSTIRTLISTVLIFAVAVALGFRPAASLAGWLGALGLLTLFTVAVTWLTVGIGLAAKTPEGANSGSLMIVILPFISSAFVPAASMPAGVRWFAANQPFTPVIQTIRGLLTGTPIGHSAAWAVAWCLLIGAVGYSWALARYNRTRAT
jgi:ABC-2 type transport system permease protein